VKRLIIAIGIAGGLWMSGCAIISSSETPKQFMDSSIITASVKARLADTVGLEKLNLTIQTLDSNVLLSGFVQSEAQKTLAGRVAENTQGVRKVINKIVVQ